MPGKPSGPGHRPGQDRGRRWHPWTLALVAVLGLGLWGFAHLRPTAPEPAAELDPLHVLYGTLKLFTLDLDVPAGAEPPWPLWLAALAAPVLTLRGIAELFREQVARWLIGHVVRARVVVFGANERSAALLRAAPRPGRWRDALVVVDPDPAALATLTAPRVWTVRGVGTSTAALRRAGVPHAGDVVVTTGDNATNSAITTAVLDLRLPRPPQVYVEVEEAGLARTLEQGGHRAGVRITAFTATAVAAGAVVDGLDAAHRRRSGRRLLDPEEDGTGAAVVLFGTGDLVDAVVLELHRRCQVRRLEEPADQAPTPRVVVFGPDAGRRRSALARLLGTELTLLDLEALDVDLDQAVELDLETARHLSRCRPIRQVLVLAATDLDAGGIALTLGRHLGPDASLALVTAGASTPFGDEIARQSAVSPTLPPIALFRVPDQAYDLARLAAERVVDRLARALHETEDDGHGTTPWESLGPDDRYRRRQQATELIERAGGSGVPLRRASLVTLERPELPLLRALGYDRPASLARAGLGLDFATVPTLVAAGRRLLAAGDPAAFGAWCEAARLSTDPRLLDREAPTAPTGEGLDQVVELLLLRRAVLGDPAARAALGRRAGGGPVDGQASALVILAGPADAGDPTAELLDPALRGLPAGSAVWTSPAAAAVVGPVAARAGAPLRPLRAGSSASSLAVWAELLAARCPARSVRVLALPRTPAEDLLLARALGATLGRIETEDAPELRRTLLNGGTGLVALPPDRMTVRAFLRPTRWPERLADLRVPVARELHSRYVTRQRGRKPPGDPVLRPWSELSPWLQRSNLAVVDDVPTKLAALGLVLGGPDDGPATTGWVEPTTWAREVEGQIELLAEIEHGRFTAERLLSGWTNGVREPGRFLTPHLTPWSELDEETRDYDREVVRDLPSVLALHGVPVLRAAAPSPGPGSPIPKAVEGAGRFRA